MKRLMAVAFATILAIGATHTVYAANNTTSTVQEFKSDMNAKLAQVDVKMRNLETQISKNVERNRQDVNISLQKRISEFKDVRSDIARKMDSLQTASSNQYAQLRQSIEESYNKLQAEIDASLN